MKRFIPPSVEDVKEYCAERENGIDAEQFVDYYESVGWSRGKNKIKCWKACVRTWERNNKGPLQTRNISIKNSLTDRSWAETNRRTRDIPLQKRLTDRSWAEK